MSFTFVWSLQVDFFHLFEEDLDWNYIISNMFKSKKIYPKFSLV
jgi:hypothetical protein